MDDTQLSMTEAHGGGAMPGSLASSSSDGSFADQDDTGARSIRDQLREYRGQLANVLAEKMNMALLQALLMAQVISAGELDKIKTKQRRQQKASCLIDIVSRKCGTDLKVFVDTLKAHCPRAHNLLKVYESQPVVPVLPTRNSSEALVLIERNRQRASTQLSKCLSDTHYGPYSFYRELKSVLNNAVDITLVVFENGFNLMHELIHLDKVDYLKYIKYAGIWTKLYNLPTDSDQCPIGRVTPMEYAVRLKRPKIKDALTVLNSEELKLHEVDRCVREGDVRRFRDLKVQHRSRVERTDPCVLLSYACQSGSLPMLHEVIKTGQEQGYPRMAADQALGVCVDTGHHLLLQPLLEYTSTRIGAVLVEGKSLIERAAVQGDLATFRALERLGTQLPDTIVALAAAQNRLPFLQDIFRGPAHDYNLNFQDRRRKSAAHFAAEKGHHEVVRLLLDKGLDITLKDKRNFSILHAAASGGSLPTVEVILNAADRQHRLHAMLHERDKYLGAERCFLVRGRDHEQSAWHYVEADRGRIEVFRRRTQGGAVDVAAFGIVLKSGWGSNPTAEVIQEVEGLYDVLNADPNAPPDMQPLHVAIIKCHEAVALKLISVMDDIGQPDRFGLTPLHLAAMRGNLKVIKALLDKGANRTVTDNQGRSALHIAEANEHQAAVTALTPVTRTNDTEEIRRKLLEAYHNLAKEKVDAVQQQGHDSKRYIKSLLRDTVADINDFLYDSLGEGPIAAETAPGGHM